MADNLTTVAEDRTLLWLTGQAATAPVPPMRIRLVRTYGTDATAGNEITTSADGYQPKDITFSAPVNGVISNDVMLRWEALSTAFSVEVVGVEIWDSAPTPVRWFYGPLQQTRSVEPNDPVEFVAGALTLSLG